MKAMGMDGGSMEDGSMKQGIGGHDDGSMKQDGSMKGGQMGSHQGELGLDERRLDEGAVEPGTG